MNLLAVAVGVIAGREAGAARRTAGDGSGACADVAVAATVALALVVLGIAMVAPAGAGLPRLAVLLVVAPLTEEAIFRAGLQEALMRHTRATARTTTLATALAFGLAHALWRGDAAAFAVALPALAIGAVYARGRRLRHCVALHALMNAVWLAATTASFVPALGT